MISSASLDEKDAATAIGAVLAALRKQSRCAVVAVCDNHGELLALTRCDGAAYSSVTVATNKAYTAARESQPTKALGHSARELGQVVSYYGDAKFTGFAGGLPVIVGGRTLGAVGVSGLTEEEDEQFAQIGVNALLRSHSARRRTSPQPRAGTHASSSRKST